MLWIVVLFIVVIFLWRGYTNRRCFLRGVAPRDLALLAAAAMEDEGRLLPPDWARERRVSPQAGHLSLCVDIFTNFERKCVVVAVRGPKCDTTESTRIRRNLLQAGTQLPDLVTLVRQQMDVVATDWSDYEKYLTGHSLGASAAEAAWLSSFEESGWSSRALSRKDWRCVTFESPGFKIPNAIEKKVRNSQKVIDDRVLHFLAAPNPINTLHPHLSHNRYRVFVQPLTVAASAAKVVRSCLDRLWTWLPSHNPLHGFTTACVRAVARRFALSLSRTRKWLSGTAAATRLRALWARLPFTSALNEVRSTWTGVIWENSPELLRWNATYVLGDVAAYVKSEHAMASMCDSFSRDTGLPLVCARIKSWPTFACDKGTTVVSFSQDRLADNRAQEKEIESLAGYSVAITRCLTEARIKEVLEEEYKYRDVSSQPVSDYVALEHELLRKAKAQSKGCQLPHV